MLRIRASYLDSESQPLKSRALAESEERSLDSLRGGSLRDDTTADGGASSGYIYMNTGGVKLAKQR